MSFDGGNHDADHSCVVEAPGSGEFGYVKPWLVIKQTRGKVVSILER